MAQKYALVTGGSSGIGKEIALHLARKGIAVCINFSKSEKEAIAVKTEIEKTGGTAVIFKADVSVESEVKKMFMFIKQKFGSLHYLINNAGIDHPQKIEEYNYSDWKKILEVNLNGKFLCIKYAVPLLKFAESPRIVNICSRLSTRPLAEASAYCCSEAAVHMLTRVAALELSDHNIKVNSVSPGLTRTPLTEKILSEDDFIQYGKNNPSKRVGTTLDIAHTVFFLLSPEAEFINGEDINVSGGILLK